MSKLNDALWRWGDPAIGKNIESAVELVRLLRDQIVELETDRDRLDYLQSGNLSVYEVYRTEHVPTTEADPCYREERVPLGWVISGKNLEFETIRGAIDAAIGDDQ